MQGKGQEGGSVWPMKFKLKSNELLGTDVHGSSTARRTHVSGVTAVTCLVLVSRYALRGSPRGVGVPRNVTTVGGAAEMKNGGA